MSEFSDCEKIMAENEMCIILPMLHSSRSKRLSCIHRIFQDSHFFVSLLLKNSKQ